MARPEGTKHFLTPDDLWSAFESYREWAKSNPWIKNDFIKSGEFAGQIVGLSHERPLTEWEFAAHVELSYQGLRNYGEAEGYEDYFDTYHRIKTIMTAQRVSGALVDAFNAGLVSKIDGIIEKKELELSGEINIGDKLAAARARVAKNDQP